MDFYNILLYKPLFNALIFIYNYIPGKDFGLAIITLTIAIKFLLVPLSMKAVKSQKRLQEVQPKLKEIQEKYKNNKEVQAQKLLEIYKTEKINPFGGLFVVIIQLPILIALYSVFSHGLQSDQLGNLYNFVANPGQITASFLGIIDLARPNIAFAAIAGFVQFLQTKTMLPKQQSLGQKEEQFMKMMNMQMTYIMPVMTFFILFTLPSALGLYWITSGIFATIQQYFILKTKKNGTK
jgi:YidC/Oxa1 family membrane protein insertase